VESGEGIERQRLDSSFSHHLDIMWNPVKELKVRFKLFHVDFNIRDVESGEGIESPP